MNCPKCKSNMKVIKIRGYEIDRCQNCKGIWFDHMECDELSLLDNPEFVDVGDSRVGQRFNKIDKIECPTCKTPLGRLSPEDQPEIIYEACSTCKGIFFDAGEYRDFLKSAGTISFKNLRP